MLLKYCPRCRKETRHRRLKKTGFLTQCVIAAIGGFGVSLLEPELECNSCGRKCDE